MPSIDRFAAAVATVTAGVFAPLAIGAVALVDSLPWWLWLAILAGSGFLGGFVASRATVTPWTPDRFRGGWRVVVPFAAAPAILAVGYGVWLTTDLPFEAVWVPVGVGALLTVLGGMFVATTARSLYGTRLTDESQTHLELPPEQSAAALRQQRLAGGVLFVGIVAVTAWYWTRGADVSLLVFVAITPLTLLLGTPEERAAVDAGLKQGAGVEPWDAFDGYRVTDDDIVLEREAWYRSDVSIDRDRLDDEDALVDVLSAVLPERY